jgi:2-methylcitrate dehydratase PrpD
VTVPQSVSLAGAERPQEASVTAVLAAYAANLRYESLPPAVVAVLKRIVLDTLGTTLAANTLSGACQTLLDVARAAGGTRESTLIGWGDKVPALMAALANGGMAHALNYDAGGAGHLGLLVPAPLAAAEQVGGVSGQQLLAGLAAGVELTARLAVAARSGASSHTRGAALEGQVLGYFGTAAGAGRVLGLDVRAMHSALGLALMQAAGTMQVVLDGDPPAKAIYAAFANHGGMLASLLAKQGLGAECAAIEGAAGLYALYYEGRYDGSVLAAGLGEQYYLLGTSFKPWPTSGHVHPFIEASLDLVHRQGVRSTEIQQVQLRGAPTIRAWFEPMEERKRPQDVATAGNSPFFGVAKALANGQVTLGDFTPSGLQQPEALRLAERMSYAIDPELSRAGVVELRTTGGSRYTSRIDTPLGHAARPMTPEQLVAKFRDCAQYAAQLMPGERLDDIVEMVDRLEEMPDVAALLRLCGAH